MHNGKGKPQFSIFTRLCPGWFMCTSDPANQYFPFSARSTWIGKPVTDHFHRSGLSLCSRGWDLRIGRHVLLPTDTRWRLWAFAAVEFGGNISSTRLSIKGFSAFSDMLSKYWILYSWSQKEAYLSSWISMFKIKLFFTYSLHFLVSKIDQMTMWRMCFTTPKIWCGTTSAPRLHHICITSAPLLHHFCFTSAWFLAQVAK